jgi:hypothetical protein
VAQAQLLVLELQVLLCVGTLLQPVALVQQVIVVAVLPVRFMVQAAPVQVLVVLGSVVVTHRVMVVLVLVTLQVAQVVVVPVGEPIVQMADPEIMD